MTSADWDVFPPLRSGQIDAARTSSWYPNFRDVTIESLFIDIADIGEEGAFREWLESDSIFLPEGSQSNSPTAVAGPSSPPQNGSTSPEPGDVAPVYRLPRMNQAIRTAISDLGGSCLPKLNWTAPRDAAFMVPQTAHGPLYCTTPADIYLLLKSSDFISHGIDPSTAYASGHGEEEGAQLRVRIELVLKRFVEIHPSREFRCFVRDNRLLAISQRDPNYYEHLQDLEAHNEILDCIEGFWLDHVQNRYDGGPDYIFDVFLSSDLSKATLVDFNPYRTDTDPLTFTYEELHSLSDKAASSGSESLDLPMLRVIDAAAPEANRNAPTFGENMMPLEVMSMSQGKNLHEFQHALERAVGADQGAEDSDEG